MHAGGEDICLVNGLNLHITAAWGQFFICTGNIGSHPEIAADNRMCHERNAELHGGS